jgi:GNAT superfamily N-acetyltransferase
MNDEARLRIRAVLDADPGWAAYALADLDPAQDPVTQWYVAPGAVVLCYHAIRPPVLFAQGTPAEVKSLFDQVPAGEYLYTLLGTHRTALRHRMEILHEAKMWRMVLRPEEWRPRPGETVELRASDLGKIEDLFGGHPDRPDAFAPYQLEDGFFFGVRQAGRLISLAGTHVVSRRFGVAAVGNVFTHPEARGAGHGTRATSAVVQALLDAGIGTIALNVNQANEPAVRSYRSLGFWPFVGYYEGTCRLAAAKV